MKIGLTLLLLYLWSTLIYSQSITVPIMINQEPKAGLRVKIVPETFEGTDIYYSLYLPENYKQGKKYPVIVEYTGNKWPPSGSTGEVKDANLGYAIAKNIEAIWVVFPYVKNKKSITTWWGNEEETIDFALSNIRKICTSYGGNPAEIFICGFSRGAIAVNYLGLYNKEISDVWLGFFSHDHYDGVNEWKGTDWGAPLLEYRQNSKERFYRIKGRNCLISENVSEGSSTFKTKEYIEENQFDTLANINYNLIPIQSVIPEIPSKTIPHVHTDKWLLYKSNYANDVYDWFKQTIKTKPNTYSISGVVSDINDNPISGVIVESGKTHFTITNKNGEYILEGLIQDNRKISVFDNKNHYIVQTQNVNLESDNKRLDFTITN